MGDETRVVFKVITTPSGLISAKLGSLSAQWGLRSVVSNSLDRYLPGRHDEPGLTVVVSAELGEWLRGLGPGSLHEVSHAGRNGTQALGRSATSV